MPSVICRPQLHHATTEQQYADFHALMSGYGLERTIIRDGREYRLPNGEYLGVNITTPVQILALKIDAAARLVSGFPCKLTLAPTDASQIYIHGLEEVPSFAAELGAFSAIAGIAAAQSKGGSLSVAHNIPSSLQTSFLDASSGRQ